MRAFFPLIAIFVLISNSACADKINRELADAINKAKPGDLISAIVHLPENIGDKPMEVILIEMKVKPLETSLNVKVKPIEASLKTE